MWGVTRGIPRVSRVLFTAYTKQAMYSDSETRNPKPETRNPKPETLGRRHGMCAVPRPTRGRARGLVQRTVWNVWNTNECDQKDCTSLHP